MKNVIRYYFLIILLSCLPLISIFITSKLFHSHDGLVHLARIAAYFKALRDGEFPVRWAGDLNYGYGMPLFNFMYQIPYAIASLFVLFGLGLVNAFKFTIALSYLSAGIFMFAFAKEFFQDNKKALLIAVFYQFAPFRLVELLIRGSFGEVYTYAFLPLVLYGLTRYFKKQSYGNFLIVSIAVFFLILSHNALSLVFFGICAGFMVLFTQTKKKLLQSFLPLLAGLLLAGFYWIPAIAEHKYTYGDLFMKDLYLEHFPPLQNFFIPNFFNSSQLQTKGISVQIGFFHLLAIMFSLAVLLRKDIDKKIKILISGSLFLFVVVLFFMQPISIPIWAHSPLLRQFQFSWRLLGIVSFISSLLAISFFSFSFFQKIWIYIMIIILTIGSTAYYWKPALGYDSIHEPYYWNFPLTSTYFGETDVIWSAGPAKAYPRQRIEFIDGYGSIANFTRKTNTQKFTIIANTNGKLVDHTEYFPGWRVYVNGNPVPIQFQDQNWRGQITFSVPQGRNNVTVIFGETPLRLLADMVSLLSMGALVILGFISKKNKILNIKN